MLLNAELSRFFNRVDIYLKILFYLFTYFITFYFGFTSNITLTELLKTYYTFVPLFHHLSYQPTSVSLINPCLIYPFPLSFFSYEATHLSHLLANPILKNPTLLYGTLCVPTYPRHTFTKSINLSTVQLGLARHLGTYGVVLLYVYGPLSFL